MWLLVPLCILRSDEKFWQLVLSFHFVGSGHQTQGQQVLLPAESFWWPQSRWFLTLNVLWDASGIFLWTVEERIVTSSYPVVSKVFAAGTSWESILFNSESFAQTYTCLFSFLCSHRPWEESGGHPSDQHSPEWPLLYHHSRVFRELSGHRLFCGFYTKCKYFLLQNSATSGIDTPRGPLVRGWWEQEGRQDRLCPRAEYGRGRWPQNITLCLPCWEQGPRLLLLLLLLFLLFYTYYCFETGSGYAALADLELMVQTGLISCLRFLSARVTGVCITRDSKPYLLCTTLLYE